MIDFYYAQYQQHEGEMMMQMQQETVDVNQLGDGQRALFWWDVWLDSLPLALRFCSLYNLCTNKLVPLAEAGHLSWSRDLFEWEQDVVRQLQSSYNELQFRPVTDRYHWSLKDDGHFSIKSCSNGFFMLRTDLGPDAMLRSSWPPSIPFRVAFFSWLALCDDLSTRDVLLRRHVIPAPGASYALCPAPLESSSHLFVHCCVARGRLGSPMLFADTNYFAF